MLAAEAETQLSTQVLWLSELPVVLHKVERADTHELLALTVVLGGQ